MGVKSWYRVANEVKDHQLFTFLFNKTLKINLLLCLQFILQSITVTLHQITFNKPVDKLLLNFNYLNAFVCFYQLQFFITINNASLQSFVFFFKKMVQVNAKNECEGNTKIYIDSIKGQTRPQ